MANEYSKFKQRIQARNAGAFGAAAGDMEGWLREVGDSAIVGIERAFTRARLKFREEPLNAESPFHFDKPARSSRQPYLDFAYPVYSWVSRQFANGLEGRSFANNSVTHDESPGARLGHDVYKIGQKVAEEVERRAKIPGIGHAAFVQRIEVYRERALEEIRGRLYWPEPLQENDTRPPSKWPEAD